MENGIKEKHKIKKEDILLGHIAKYYYHKGRRLNNDDILPVSRILPAMEEYANTKFLPAMKEKDGQLKELDKLYQYSLEQYRVELRRANELVIENAKQSEEIEKLRGFAKRILEVTDNAPELNMGNYSDERVKELNDSMIEASQLAREFTEALKQKDK